MKTIRSSIAFVVSAAFLAMLWTGQAFAQTKQAKIFLTKDQIVEGAKKEGKLRVVPGHDDSVIPTIVKAFQKKYPFIQTSWGIVTGIEAGQRQLFEMTAGTSNADAFNLSAAFFSEFFSKNLIKGYDFQGMSKAGHLKIPLEMIDDSGVVVWLATNTGVLTYNSNLVPPDKTPKGWDSCLDPYFKSKFSVDPKPNILTWLAPRWGEEKLISMRVV
jgi:hypothetical protein